MPQTRLSPQQVAQLAEAERARILHQDIIGLKTVDLHPLPEAEAARELTRFSQELWRMPNMHGYFDRRHIANLRHHQHEALHGLTQLPGGGILEILSIPTLPAEAMGFHLFLVFDPRDDHDRGRFIGYTVWSLEKGDTPFGRADTVRMAFDIFPPYREQRYRKIRFVNHDIYNISRRILYGYRPRCFVVEAQTQISQTRTGNPLKRCAYYLRRGYYPPDQKELADRCLVRVAKGRRIGADTLRRLLHSARSPFWIYPIDQYRRHRPDTPPGAGHLQNAHPRREP
jgi:hypothetical protein